MSDETPHWGSRELGKRQRDHSPLRSLITTELSETRIFVDQLYREFTASGRRIQTGRLVQSRGDSSPWFSLARDGDY